MSRPLKYSDDHRLVRVKIDIHMTQSEYDLLTMYSRGVSMKDICRETGCEFKTLVNIFRRNIGTLLDSKGL